MIAPVIAASSLWKHCNLLRGQQRLQTLDIFVGHFAALGKHFVGDIRFVSAKHARRATVEQTCGAHRFFLQTSGLAFANCLRDFFIHGNNLQQHRGLHFGDGGLNFRSQTLNGRRFFKDALRTCWSIDAGKPRRKGRLRESLGFISWKNSGDRRAILLVHVSHAISQINSLCGKDLDGFGVAVLNGGEHLGFILTQEITALLQRLIKTQFIFIQRGSDERDLIFGQTSLVNHHEQIHILATQAPAPEQFFAAHKPLE